MKRLLVLLLCLMAFSASAQSISFNDRSIVESSNPIMNQARENLKKAGIDKSKATMQEWKVALKDIGKVTSTDTILTCFVSDTSSLVMTWQNGELVQVCERKSGEE